MSHVTNPRCPNCGAPIAAPSATRSMRCSFCSALLTPSAGAWRALPAAEDDEPLPNPELPRLWVGGLRYALLGRLARGDDSDVFFARRDARLTELVILKARFGPSSEPRHAREQATLDALEASTARGTSRFARLLPQRVDHGLARLGMHGRDGERRVAVFRWRSGFVHTMKDVCTTHSSGIAPEASVWLWKRMLELLGWVHESGFVHGAVLPAHALVHARDHGVVLAGWSSAVRIGQPLEALVSSERAFYPDDVAQGGALTPQHDLAMSARVILAALSGNPLRAASSTPRPLAELLESHARMDANASESAWALRDRLDAAAQACFGPPKFIPFPMPGWAYVSA